MDQHNKASGKDNKDEKEIKPDSIVGRAQEGSDKDGSLADKEIDEDRDNTQERQEKRGKDDPSDRLL